MLYVGRWYVFLLCVGYGGFFLFCILCGGCRAGVDFVVCRLCMAFL